MASRLFSLPLWAKSFTSRAIPGWRLLESMAANRNRSLMVLMRIRDYSNGTLVGSILGDCRKQLRTFFASIRVSAKIIRISQPNDLIAGSFSVTRSADRIAFTVSSPTSIGEVFVSDGRSFTPRKLTNFNEQTKSFALGTREVISWQSQDGTTLEGVLIKPANFDPAKRYPLLCIIHGGPTGIDRPVLLTPDARYYPSDIWVARGAFILKVNYRGSAGYGEKFRKLNVGNLGVGDAWDVLSGVDFLIAKGWVDKNKVACMGWSQGGYISAFLTASSDRFVAISVGAGISDWATYYYNTDITPFTINYLGNDPAEDPAI